MDHPSLKISPPNHHHHVSNSLTISEPSQSPTDATMKKPSHLHLHHPHLHRHHHKHKQKQTSHRDSQGHSPAAGQDSRSRTAKLPESNGDPRRDSDGHVLQEGSVKPDNNTRIKEPYLTALDLMKLEQRRQVRDEILSRSITELKELSSTTSRWLDEQYYSILEKFTKLDSTISSIQEMSYSTAQLRLEFENEVEQMETDVKGQLKDSGSFELQRAKISGLAERLNDGRDRLDNLQSRITNVRQKIAEWERSELEWRVKTRRRLRFLWGVITFGILLFVAATVFQYLPSENNEALSTPPPHDLTEHLGSAMIMQRLSSTTMGAAAGSNFLLSRSQGSEDDDPRLRLFDEL